MSFGLFFHFFILDFFIILLHQNEAMNALDQLKERASKREENLVKEIKKKEAKERELQKVR
jgi:hypothetical protein